MKVKRVLTVVLFLVLISALGQSYVVASTAGVWATILQTNTDWNMALANNAQTMVDEIGWEHIVLNAEGDIQKQLDLIQSAISQRVTGMFIHSLDDNAIANYVAKAIDAGIYVYISTTGVLEILDEKYTKSGMLYGVDYNHYHTGELTADALAASIGYKGKVAVLAGTAGASNTQLRTAGFVDRVAAEYPDVTVVNVINVDWDQIRAMTATENLLVANPDLKGVYAMAEDMMVGAVEAIENYGKDVDVVGIDASTRIVEMVMDGRVAAVVNCATDGSGLGAIITKHILEGQSLDEIEGVVVSGNMFGSIPFIITQENASFDLVDY
jgi:ribose transport system substrate-binding protein